METNCLLNFRPLATLRDLFTQVADRKPEQTEVLSQTFGSDCFEIENCLFECVAYLKRTISSSRHDSGLTVFDALQCVKLQFELYFSF